MKEPLLNVLLEAEEAIKYKLKPSKSFLEKKYKIIRRNSAIDLFKWVSAFIILLIAPLLIFPNFFTEILPFFLIDLGSYSSTNEFWMLSACIYFIMIFFFGILLIGLYFFISIMNYMPISFQISWNEERELIITNKKLIIINKKKEFSFHYIEDFYNKDPDHEIYSVIIRDGEGLHLAFSDIQFNNLDLDENLSEIQEFLHGQIKKIYPKVKFSDKKWYERDEFADM